MATKKQIDANRGNAKLSTGPKTRQGKRRSRLNAIRHGLTAAQVVMADEDPEDFSLLRDQLMNEWGPTGATELCLVERIAVINWRLLRAARFEVAVLNARQADIQEPDQRRRDVEAYLKWIDYSADPPKPVGPLPRWFSERMKLIRETGDPPKRKS